MTTQNTFILGDLANMGDSSAFLYRYHIENDLRYKAYKRYEGVDKITSALPADEILYENVNFEKNYVTEAVGIFSNPEAIIAKGVGANGTTVNYTVVARTKEALEYWVAETEKWVEKKEVPDQKVSVSFWAMGAQGPRSWQRQIEVPTWEEIRGNYATDVQEQLDRIIQRKFNSNEGKLVLLHGPPGGGKTYSIRALLNGWKKNATISYVVDPERFLSAQPSYMLELVLDVNDRPRRRWSADLGDYIDEDNADNTHYHLLIMEDTGELLAADAKDRAGQGLSRLLNLVDGMIGQGINLIVLLTTNEHIDTFHGAVTRDGRCLAKIEIDKLTVHEANAWLREHGSNEHVREDKSLAELYAIANRSSKPAEAVEIIRAGQYL